MPFNKGDFTQQGVNGHVNATVRLNEKRLVNIDLTSNEEAEGCTIAGTVTDLLNDKVYPIGSGVSGNIEITENGENINVAPYATATVNVSGGGGGGGDIPLCTITFVPQGPATIADYLSNDHIYILPALYDNGIIDMTPLSEAISTNTVLSFMYNKYTSPIPPSETVYSALLFNEGEVTAADAVNCTFEYGEIIITDASLPSSITVTLVEK